MALHSSSSVSFPDDTVSYFVPNWDELMELSFQLSVQISEDRQLFPVMVTLAKGGLPLARILADFLQIPCIVSMGVRFYSGVDQRFQMPQIYQDIAPSDSIRGKKVLLFDDIADTGESLLFAKEHVQNLGAAEVVSATLFYKERSKVVPDYFSQQTSDWVVFPFEAMETVRYLSTVWDRSGVLQAEQRQRFLQLGLREHWLEALEKEKGSK
jgi:hypoxanthine phosphoribosyltransferase